VRAGAWRHPPVIGQPITADTVSAAEGVAHMRKCVIRARQRGTGVDNGKMSGGGQDLTARVRLRRWDGAIRDGLIAATALRRPPPRNPAPEVRSFQQPRTVRLDRQSIWIRWARNRIRRPRENGPMRTGSTARNARSRTETSPEHAPTERGCNGSSPCPQVRCADAMPAPRSDSASDVHESSVEPTRMPQPPAVERRLHCRPLLTDLLPAANY